MGVKMSIRIHNISIGFVFFIDRFTTFVKLKNYTMRALLLLALFLLPFIGSTQSFMNPNAWRKYRHELMFGIGASNFLGELGGRNQIGTDFLWDIEFPKTKTGTQIIYIYKTSASTGIRTNLRYGQLAGDDKLTTEPFRNNRNLNFKSNLFELSIAFQWYFLKESGGNRYNLKNKKGRKIGAQANSIGSYLFAGVGGIYFNPKGLYGQSWIPLRPLHTEGQGLSGGPKQYKNFSVCIPVGFGFRKAFNLNWGISLEFSHAFTFTDYIDDVSGFYYDPAALSAAYGPESAYMSNPSNGSIADLFGTSNYFDPTTPGQQRGDLTDRDGYLFAMLSVNYKIKNKTGGYGRIKRKRVRASF